MSNLLEALVIVSEKAANIARICRQDQHLFELLVEEKGCAESNPRFVRDFKTLADVLIQETVRYDIGKQFSGLRNKIKGEESNAFTNKLGETIYVEVLENARETSHRLEIVLNGDEKASQILAEAVHRNVNLNEVNYSEVEIEESREFEWNFTQLGIWIDPIDSTAEYISGKEVVDENSGIALSGLKCVTVLIGVYNCTTGMPLLGIINQPFFTFDESGQGWKGHCRFGYKSYSSHLSSPPVSPNNLVCISTSEDESIKSKLQEGGFTLLEAAGAGYKILLVISGCADAYVLSKDTTFKWDTCGPQAILMTLGGDLLKFNDALNKSYVPVCYAKENTSESKISCYCNYGGILAYRDKDVCNRIIEVLNNG